MNETTPIPDAIEKPMQQTDAMDRQADTIAGSVLDWGVAPLLKAQADMLAGAEAGLADWLRRRHEAVADMRQFIARMQTSITDPGVALRAHQEMLSRSFQRLAADSDACHAAARRLVDRAPSWFPQTIWAWLPWQADSSEFGASQAAATRAAARPPRMAHRSD